jgi:hypothetical protein
MEFRVMRLVSTRRDIDRIDLIVPCVLLAMAAAILLLLLRGDQIGVQVGELVPAPDSVDVSTQTEIRLAFGEQMEKTSVERRFEVAPSVEGALAWHGNTLVWRPQ